MTNKWITTNPGFKMSLEVKSLKWNVRVSLRNLGRGSPVFHTSRKRALCCMIKLTDSKKREAEALENFLPLWVQTSCAPSMVSKPAVASPDISLKMQILSPSADHWVIQMHTEAGRSGVAVPDLAHSLMQLAIKDEGQTAIVTQGPVLSDLARTAAVRGKGRTRAGPEDGAEVTSLPKGACRGGERGFHPLHSYTDQQLQAQNLASCWLPYSTYVLSGTQIFINFDKKKLPSAF